MQILNYGKKFNRILNSLHSRDLEVLQEWAFSRSVALKKLHALSDMILIHACKIKMLKHSSEMSHWSKEMVNWILSIAIIKMKKKKSLFTYEELYESLFRGMIGDEEDLIYYIEKMVNPLLMRTKINIQDRVSISKEYAQLRKFYENLCQAMSKGEIGKISDIQIFIDKYLI